MSENIIVGLDVGSRFVRMVAGQMVLTGDKEQLHVLGAVEVASQGINKANITNIEDVVSSISVCRERLERLIGIPIENIWVSINNSQFLCQNSRGLVGVTKPNGEIAPDDVDRAIEQARTIATPSNYEILHVMPKGFSVDGQPNVKDPIGMTGIRLEVDTLLIQVPSSHLKNLTKCVHRTGLNIEDVIFSALANAEAVLTYRQKEVGAVVINIGGATTSVAVFEEGDLVHVAVLPIGSDYITQDINLCFKISLELAERLKLKYGSASPKNISKKDEINLADEGFGEEEAISRKALSEIIEARVEEIFSKVNNELKKIGKFGLLPAGAVLCGGGAKLDGIIDVAKKELRLPVTIGYPLDISSLSEKIGDPGFSTAIGLVKWGSELQDPADDFFKKVFSNIKKAAGKITGSAMGGLKNIWK
ncbi:MAG: cell division protein FtsA [Patescibacteria group bacterium]